MLEERACVLLFFFHIKRPPSLSAHHEGLVHVYIDALHHLLYSCLLYGLQEEGDFRDRHTGQNINIQNYTCSNYTVFFQIFSQSVDV